MTSQNEFLQKLVSLLDAAGISYMLAGSVGSSFHGQPRATKDVDIVIDPTESQLEHFLQSLGKGYYVSFNAARDAFHRKSTFNIIDIENSWKADLIIRRDRPFSKVEFHRRQNVNLMGTTLWVVSPEDVILSKLEWAKDCLSEQQFRDALGVAVAQYNRLDKDYMRKWSIELHLENALEQLLIEAAYRLGLTKDNQTL
jgi:hypothetical protein